MTANPVDNSAPHVSAVRLAMLAAIALSLAMMAARVFSYRPLIGMPGASKLLLETTATLVVYGLVVGWATGANSDFRRRTLRSATSLGLIGAAIMIAGQVVELRIDLASLWNGILTLSFMLSTFFVWGVAGYRNARGNSAIATGAFAGCWCAIVTMTIVVAVGFAIEFYLATPRPEYVATWAEFKRSGWTDVNAFMIANTVDSALTHLFVGPIVGAVVGAAGAFVKRVSSGDTNGVAVRQC